MHKLTLKIVTRFDAFPKEGSPLDEMLKMVSVRNSADFEYLYKIIRALDRARDRLSEAQQLLSLQKEQYEATQEVDESEPESADGDDSEAQQGAKA